MRPLQEAHEQQIVEAIDSYCCAKCQPRILSSNSEEENRTSAPWRHDEVSSLKGYQLSTLFCPYVCSNGHDLTVSANGLACEECSYLQTWAYKWTLNYAWRPRGASPPAAPAGAMVPKPPGPTPGGAAALVPRKDLSFDV